MHCDVCCWYVFVAKIIFHFGYLSGHSIFTRAKKVWETLVYAVPNSSRTNCHDDDGGRTGVGGESRYTLFSFTHALSNYSPELNPLKIYLVVSLKSLQVFRNVALCRGRGGSIPHGAALTSQNTPTFSNTVVTVLNVELKTL